MTVLTIAALTLREASRRKVLRALGALTMVLLGLSAWGFTELAAGFERGATSGEQQIGSATVLNLVMFGFSLIAALGTAFLAGPSLAGELESGIAQAVLTRPVRRVSVLAGKWLGLAVFGAGFVAVAGFAELVVVHLTLDYWPSDAAAGLALLAAQTTVLMTLALLLATTVSPMASGVVAVGLFGATWIAGVVGAAAGEIGNPDLALVGTVSGMLLPTDGLWRGAMYAFQGPGLLSSLGPGFGASPFISQVPPTAAYLAWAALWVALALGLAAVSFGRRDI